MSKSLTEQEAYEFLELMDRVEADMNDVFEKVSASAFRDAELDTEDFEAEWGATPGQVYTECTRNKHRSFVEHAYLDNNGE